MPLFFRNRRALLGGALFAACPRLTNAQGMWPNRPIKVLVPYAAGGSADNAARSYTDRLATALGQPVLVENRPGASGTLAASLLAQAPGDGYTLMVAPTAVMAITPAARKTPYDPLKDITALARLAGSQSMLTISNELGVKTLPEFIRLAKSSPGKYAFGSSGIATITHLTGEILQQSTGIKLQHVPYKSIVDGVGDLLAGRIAMVLDPFILPQVKAGRATAVASLNPQRNPEFPDVPTTDELGIDMRNFQARSWFGLFGPKNLPREVSLRLDGEIEKIAGDPGLAAKLQGLGLMPSFAPSAKFGTQLADDLAFFGVMLRELGIRLDS
jgi:tripartite-type tricarboxylate transporter receptor subunit TctC